MIDPYEITSVDQLRDIYPPPTGLATQKHIARLDHHCRQFLALSPFVVLATNNAQGKCDASPRGGPPGFVKILDDRRLLLPDLPGNRLIDTLRNVVETRRVGLVAFVPRYGEVLRITGRGRITRDPALREVAAIEGKVSTTVLVLEVEDIFLHCAKAVRRSYLWEPAHWPDITELPPAAEIFRDHAHSPKTIEEVQGLLDDSYANRMY